MQAAVGTLILATSLVQLANGFFGTFISLRLTVEDFGATLTGLVLSAYFAGFTLGALRCGRIIARIGHIRAYAAFGGLVGAATAAMPLLVDPWAWLVLRGAIGIGCVGLFITTESWLNAKARPETRGRVFSIYMVGTFVALAVGQLLIGRIAIESALPFNAIIALFAVALVLVSTTRAEPPATIVDSHLPYGQLARAAPVAVLGCVISGMISAAFYSLLPAWMAEYGIAQDTIALFMLAAVLGGLAFQVPVGWLSDAFDRRVVLAVLAAGFAAAAIALPMMPRTLAFAMPVAALLGGFMSTLYPVCVAHALDRMPSDRMVAISGRLILVSGVGSAIGPLVGSYVMRHLEIDGLLFFLAAAALVLAAVAALRRLQRAAPPHHERTFDILAPQATPLAHDPEA